MTEYLSKGRREEEEEEREEKEEEQGGERLRTLSQVFLFHISIMAALMLVVSHIHMNFPKYIFTNLVTRSLFYKGQGDFLI